MHVDVQVVASHCDYNVEVDGELGRDGGFDGVGVRRCAGEAAPELCECEVQCEGYEEEGGDGAVGSAREVGVFCFGYMNVLLACLSSEIVWGEAC